MTRADGGARHVRVAVFAPVPGAFTYRWPAMLGEPAPGIRVLVPFGRGERWGVVLGLEDAAPEAADGVRAVADRLDAAPWFDDVRREWLARIGRYYLAAPGELWEAALGWSAAELSRRFRRAGPAAQGGALPAMLAGVFRDRRALSLKTVRARAGAGAIWATIAAASKGCLQEEPVGSPFPASSRAEAPAIELHDEQRRALAAITAARGFASFLLFGETGSGKTEVYLRAAARRVAEGGQVLILVPEIGLTPMWLSRLRAHFSRVLVWHSGLSARERLAARAHLAEAEVLIGTRSALFLPLPRLAMIVIDEEHDASFKQQDGLAYSARDAALMLAQQLAIPVVLGSATPSVESWRLASEGRHALLRMARRAVGGARRLSIETVDMRGESEPVSAALRDALRDCLARGEQAMLFLNRRGYAPALQCMACGHVPECPHCAMRLTLHRRAGRLRCHACGHARRAPRACAHCGEAAFRPLGEGTERLEDWLGEHLPELRFARFDRDALGSRKRMFAVLDDFAAHRLDCLIGTQMLVKGHDFPRVTLIGVINADQGMQLPDFRAGERWWQQMTQVIGRAGRDGGEARALIQTRSPEAAWLARLDEARAEAVLDEEMALRKALRFPPFARWVRCVASARKLPAAMALAETLAARCREALPPEVEVCGPMPCAVERLAGRWRVELLLRDPGKRGLPWRLAPLLDGLGRRGDARLRVDVDPLELM